jgi:hypothetical protein
LLTSYRHVTLSDRIEIEKLGHVPLSGVIFLHRGGQLF